MVTPRFLDGKRCETSRNIKTLNVLLMHCSLRCGAKTNEISTVCKPCAASLLFRVPIRCALGGSWRGGARRAGALHRGRPAVNRTRRRRPENLEIDRSAVSSGLRRRGGARTTESAPPGSVNANPQFSCCLSPDPLEECAAFTGASDARSNARQEDARQARVWVISQQSERPTLPGEEAWN